MRSVADVSRTELEQTLTDEIARARAEARPISRLSLSRLLQSVHTINPHDAEKFVDSYCDEKAPYVPTYLSSEFGVPYLKVLAIINLVLAVGLAITTAMVLSHGGYAFLIWLALTLLFFGGAAFCWVQSVRPEKKVEKRLVTAADIANLSRPVEQPERATTGSLQ